jgi:hypothetical protein
MISHGLGFTPLGVMVNSHEDVFVSCLGLRQWSCSIYCHPVKQVTDRDAFEPLIPKSDTPFTPDQLTLLATFDHRFDVLGSTMLEIPSADLSQESFLA